MSSIKATAKGLIIDVSVFVYLDKDYPMGAMYMAYCPELDLVGYDDTQEAARKSFEVVLKDYIEYAVKHNTLEDDLKAHGWRKYKNGKLVEPTYPSMLRNTQLKNVLNRKEFNKYSVSVPV